MADVSRPPGRNRGQVILVTGLLVAVTLLVLVLLLNAVIYTENVATRGLEGDTVAADEYQETVAAEFVALLAAENAVQRSGDAPETGFENLSQRIDDGAIHLQNHTRDRWSARGSHARTAYELHEGIVVWQDDGSNFTDATTLALEINHSRSFVLNVSNDSLHPFDGSLEDVSNDSIQEHAAGINTSTGWEIRLFRVNSSEAVVTDGGNTSICDDERFVDDRLVVDVTNASVNGVDCGSPLWGDEGKPDGVTNPFDVVIENPENVSGQFELIAGGAGASSEAEHNASIVESATLELVFRSAAINYVANTTVEGDVP